MGGAGLAADQANARRRKGPKIAARRCARCWPPSGTGWWWSGCPATPPTSTPSSRVWSNLKGNELANLAAEGLGEVIAAAWQGIERIRAAWHLPYSFLRHCGLSVS